MDKIVLINEDFRVGSYFQDNLGNILCTKEIYEQTVLFEVLIDGKWEDVLLSIAEVYPIPFGHEVLVRLGFLFGDSKNGVDYFLVRDDWDIFFKIEHITKIHKTSRYYNHWLIKESIKPYYINYIHELQDLLIGIYRYRLNYDLNNN